MHTLHMHWHFHVWHTLAQPIPIFLSPLHLADASSSHYSTSLKIFSLFSGAYASSFSQPSVSPPPLPSSFSPSLTDSSTISAAHSVRLHAKPIRVWNLAQKHQDYPPHSQLLPPTFLSRAPKLPVSHNERAAELLRRDLWLVTLRHSEHTGEPLSVLLVVLWSQLSSGQRALRSYTEDCLFSVWQPLVVGMLFYIFSSCCFCHRVWSLITDMMEQRLASAISVLFLLCAHDGAKAVETDLHAAWRWQRLERTEQYPWSENHSCERAFLLRVHNAAL